jgi:hypothetical protein
VDTSRGERQALTLERLEKRVQLTKDGYVSVERRIEITAERPVRPLRVTLQPRAAAN